MNRYSFRAELINFTFSIVATVVDLDQGWATGLVLGSQLLWQSKRRDTLWAIAIKHSYTIKWYKLIQCKLCIKLLYSCLDYASPFQGLIC